MSGRLKSQDYRVTRASEVTTTSGAKATLEAGDVTVAETGFGASVHLHAAQAVMDVLPGEVDRLVSTGAMVPI
jgi:hypothetical protein